MGELGENDETRVRAGDPLRSGEGAGDVIDRYKLLEPIGEGGMGTVWLAQQSHPVQRKVALKIIKLGMDTRDVVARFEAERQALALMDHRFIAKVLDGGATKLGRPYFVMERVDGMPITAYCDHVKLGLRERLALFVRVCRALQHAHSKGVIHRDIKPSNVLVASHDGVPEPRVIDFGIAKATSGSLTEKTIHTRHAQIVGTPEYMAPEQATVGGLDVDTRADVYSLGVLLYELLTGSKPFEFKTLGGDYAELLRVIRETEPQKPSARIQTTIVDGAALASALDASQLRRALAGDLDWVVMRALEKERTRRYATVNELAQDVERYLGDEPVLAAPPSTAYRLLKLVRRRKKTVIAATVVAFLTVVGAVGTTLGLVQTRRANEALELALEAKGRALASETTQRDRAQKNEERARKAEAEARQEALRAAEAERVASLRADQLEDVALFQSEQLRRVDVEAMGAQMRRAQLAATPAESRAELVRLLAQLNFTDLAVRALNESVLEPTLIAIDEQFAEQPPVQAELLQGLASTRKDLGLVEEAIESQQRVYDIRREYFGEADAATFDALLGRANLDVALDRLEQAIPQLSAAASFAVEHFGSVSVLALSAQGALAFALMRTGDLEESERLHRDVLDGFKRVLGDEDDRTLAQMNNLGIVLEIRGKLEESGRVYEQVLAIRQRIDGEDHPETLVSMGNLAQSLQERGRLAEALELDRQVLAARERVLGKGHPDTLKAGNNLAGAYVAQGRNEAAIELYDWVLPGLRERYGDEHPESINTMNNVAVALANLERLDEAEPLQEKALALRRQWLGDEHYDTIRSITSLGALRYRQRRLEEAEELYLEAIETASRSLGENHPATLIAVSNLGWLRNRQGRLKEAALLLQRALEGRLVTLGKQHHLTIQSINALAQILRYWIKESRANGEREDLWDGLTQSGELFFQLDRFEEAADRLGEAWSLGAELFEADDERRHRASAVLAAALVSQDLFQDAEFCLLQSEDFVRAGAALSAPGRSVAARIARQLVDLYERWDAAQPGQGYAAEAEHWRPLAESLEPVTPARAKTR